MIFKPKNSMLWDTFILPYNDKFYLYYLQYNKEAWDGYGLAVSDDLIHWEDKGTILDLGAGSGTGMVYKTAEQWMLSYCVMRPGVPHHVAFACSENLINWEKLPQKYDLLPDAKWYDAINPEETSSRFGDLWVERQEDGEYIGFLTASTNAGPTGANGVIGMAKSTDGLNWKAVSPASKPCGMSWAEVGAHVELGGRHYMLVGSNSGLGCRFDPINNPTGKAGGMYVMMAENIEGPYELVENDPLLLGCRCAPPNWAYVPTYYTRIFKHEGQVLLHHHWLPRDNFIDAWLSTCKILSEEAPGKLALKWWPGNEKLKGSLLFDLADTRIEDWNMLKHYDRYTGECITNEKAFTLTTKSSALVWHECQDYSRGIFIEAEIEIDGEGAGGLLFGGMQSDDINTVEGSACLFNKRNLVEFGHVKRGLCSPSFLPENQIPWEIQKISPMHIKILLRGEFIEVYVNENLVHCYGFSFAQTKNIGFFAENCNLVVRSLKAYNFNL